MGLFDPTPNEMSLIQNWFSGASNFLGNEMYFYPVLNYPYENPQGDPIPQWGSPILVNGILDPRPSRRTLNGLGWYSEDPDLTPILAYLPANDRNGNPLQVTQDARIGLPHELDGFNEVKQFEIKKFLSTSIPIFYWICYVVPTRISTSYVNTNPSSNFNYLNFNG